MKTLLTAAVVMGILVPAATARQSSAPKKSPLPIISSFADKSTSAAYQMAPPRLSKRAQHVAETGDTQPKPAKTNPTPIKAASLRVSAGKDAYQKLHASYPLSGRVGYILFDLETGKTRLEVLGHIPANP